MSRNRRLRNCKAKIQAPKLTGYIIVAPSEPLKNCRESLSLDSNSSVANLDQNQARLVPGALHGFRCLSG